MFKLEGDHQVALLFTIKFMFSKKAIEIDEIFTLDLTLYSKCQIDGEDFANFCGLLRKHKVQHNDNPHVGTQVNSSLWQMIVTVDLSLS